MDLQISYLFKFFQSLSGPEWKQCGGWCTEVSIHEWDGVFLDDTGRVVGINLHENLLKGVIPPEIDSLAAIETLNISRNQVTGPIPYQLTNLKYLKQLYLHENNLIGKFPIGISNMSQLMELSLHSNRLKGSIPDIFQSLQQLTVLDLHNNHFSGVIPLSIGQLSSLQILNLSNNNLKGYIPTGSCGLCQLRILNLSHNKLCGPLPDNIGSMEALTELLIHHNEFIGSIPDSVCLLRKLTIVSLHHNRFRGSIPDRIGELKQLEELYLHHNFLIGEWPDSMIHLRRLRILNLSFNHLTGEIPNYIFFFKKLEILSLRHNQFEGSLPTSISKLKDLKCLDINNNQFTGYFLNLLIQLPQLTTLEVNNNPITAEYNTDFSHMTPEEQLQYLRVMYYTPPENMNTVRVPHQTPRNTQLQQQHGLQGSRHMTSSSPTDSNRQTMTMNGHYNNNSKSVTGNGSSDANDVMVKLTSSYGVSDASMMTSSYNIDSNKYTLENTGDSSMLSIPLNPQLPLSDHTIHSHDSQDSDSSSQQNSHDIELIQNTLFEAAKSGYLEIIRFLIKYKNADLLYYNATYKMNVLTYFCYTKFTEGYRLFTSYPSLLSSQTMYKQVVPTSVNYKDYYKYFEFPLFENEYCVRGCDYKCMKNYWFNKVAESWLPLCVYRKYIVTPMRYMYYKQKVMNINNNNTTTIKMNMNQSQRLSASSNKVIDLSTKSTDEAISFMDEYAHIDLHMTIRMTSTAIRYKVHSYTLPFMYMSSLEYIKAFAILSTLQDDVSIFENENVKVAVQAAWDNYGKWYHIGVTSIYICYMGFLSYSHYAYQEDFEHRLIISIFVLFFNSTFTIMEVFQFFQANPLLYITDIENYIEVFAYILVYVGTSRRLINGHDTESARELLAVATVLLWVNTLSYLRPFSYTGSLIRMIWVIIIAIMPFFLILALVLYGFSQAFYLLAYDDVSNTNYASPQMAYLQAFAFITGNAEFLTDFSINSVLYTTINVLFMTFVQILLLNLLIAYLNYIYTNIQAQSEAQSLRERCHVITSQIRFTHPRGPKWLHYIKRKPHDTHDSSNTTTTSTSTSNTTTYSSSSFSTTAVHESIHGKNNENDRDINIVSMEKNVNYIERKMEVLDKKLTNIQELLVSTLTSPRPQPPVITTDIKIE